MTSQSITFEPANPGPREPTGPGTGMTPLLAVWRSRWAVLFFAVAMTCFAAVVVSRLPVRFAAAAAIVLDTRQTRVVNADSLLSNQAVDVTLLRTRIEELRSFQIASSAAEQLGTERIRAYCTAERKPSPWLGPRIGPWLAPLLDRIHLTLGWLGLADLRSVEEACQFSIEDAALFLLSAVSGVSDGRSMVIWVTAQTGDPQLSADIANAYSTAFIIHRRREMQRIAEQARAWLNANAFSLRQQMETAAAAVERYRTENRITPLNGGTLLDKRLSDLDAELSTTTAELTQKRSLLRQLQALAQGAPSLDGGTAPLASVVNQNLLVRFADARRMLADLRTRFGPAHPDVVSAEAQIDRLQQQIRSEADRALAGLTTEVAALESRRANLTEGVDVLLGQMTQQGATDVRLRELERDAALARTLHDSMLTRVTQIQAEQSMQSADAYVAIAARPPLRPVFPRTTMILVGVFFVGLAIGAVLCIARLLLRPQPDSLDSVEGRIGVPVLGVFLASGRRPAPQDAVVRDPMSAEAEAVHSILASLFGLTRLRLALQGRAVLVTSALPAEGKSSLSVALGRSAARAGLSVILVDCDLRRPAALALCRIGPATEQPDADLAKDLEAVSPFGGPFTDLVSGMHLLSVLKPIENPHSALASTTLPELLNRLRNRYDLVILDTAPVLAVADALRLAPMADEVLLVSAWKETPQVALMAALRSLQRSGAAVAGIVFSKVKLRELAWAGSARSYYAKSWRKDRTHA